VGSTTNKLVAESVPVPERPVKRTRSGRAVRPTEKVVAANPALKSTTTPLAEPQPPPTLLSHSSLSFDCAYRSLMEHFILTAQMGTDRRYSCREKASLHLQPLPIPYSLIAEPSTLVDTSTKHQTRYPRAAVGWETGAICLMGGHVHARLGARPERENIMPLSIWAAPDTLHPGAEGDLPPLAGAETLMPR